MKVLYLGNFGNKFSDTTERHIAHALTQLGHEVIEFDEKGFNIQAMLSLKTDMVLFHKGGENHGIGAETLVQFLNMYTGKKVCWYFDKFYNGRELWAELVIPFVDHFFVTDETYFRRNRYDNMTVLRQGIGNEDMSLGTPRDEFKHDIVFTGSVYGERQHFMAGLKEVYGDRFQVIGDAFGRDLYDLCASAKIFVAPKYPQDNFYWSSRVYMILGSGGFLIHPLLDGMKEEFEDKKHLVFYRNGTELREKIDYYLAHDAERKEIQLQGYSLVTEKYTYLDRVKSLLATINEKSSH
jgi:hypothetical protein